MNKKKSKKKQVQSTTSDLKKKLNPLITIQADKGEQLYAIVDFSLPDEPEIRRYVAPVVMGVEELRTL
jgi:hypothetical protein